MNILQQGLSLIWRRIQGSLMPWLEEKLGELTEKHRLIVTVLEVIRIEDYIPYDYQWYPGRPPSDRRTVGPSGVGTVVCGESSIELTDDRHAD